MRKVTRHILSKIPRRKEDMPEGRQIAIGMIITLGLFIAACVAFAKIPALQLAKPESPSVKTASATPSSVPVKTVAVRKNEKVWLDDPARKPLGQGGIGRR